MTIRVSAAVSLLVLFVVAVSPSALCAQSAAPGDAGRLPVVEYSQPEDSAVKAILETNPSTPSEWARAAKIMADLRRADLARSFAKKILDSKLDSKQLAALEEEFGSAMFVSLGAQAVLLPEGKQLANAVLAAAEREKGNPQRLAGLVKQLQDPSAEVRDRAVAGLSAARGAAVGPLVTVLADPARASEHAAARAVLVRLGRDAVQPLISALDAADPKLVVEVIKTLADLQAPQAIVELVLPCVSPQGSPEVRQAAAAALMKLTGRVPGQAEGARLLARRAQEYFEQRQTVRADEERRAEVWNWNSTAKQPVSERIPADEANRRAAARLAQQAHRLQPDDAEIRRLYLTTILEKAAYETGLDKPLPTGAGTPAETAAGFDRAVLEDVLLGAMATGHSPAAVAATRVLAGKGSADELLCQGAEPSPLVRATRHPDQRLRMAAVEAILRLKPTHPFAGSNHATEALAYVIATSGSRRVLVVDPMRAEARRVGGLLSGMGYHVETAVTAAEAMRQLIASPDYEAVLIGASLGESTIETLVQQMRFDNRTAWLPVGILGRLEQTRLAKHLAGDDRLTMAFVRPHTAEDAQWQVGQLLSRLGPLAIPFAERQQHAVQALTWLVDLSAQPSSVFNLAPLEAVVLRASWVPSLAPQSTKFLANLGTARGQEALVEQASHQEQPLAIRQAAVSAFRQSVEKHGVLLTSKQVLRQYDRYNQSASFDQPTQQVLGLILDAIEARAKLSGH